MTSDPNHTLDLMRQARTAVLDAIGGNGDLITSAAALAAQVTIIDDHLSKGGARPADWYGVYTKPRGQGLRACDRDGIEVAPGTMVHHGHHDFTLIRVAGFDPGTGAGTVDVRVPGSFTIMRLPAAFFGLNVRKET